LLSLQLLQLRAPKKEGFFCCSSFLLSPASSWCARQNLFARRQNAPGGCSDARACWVFWGWGVLLCWVFWGWGGLLVEDRSSWAKRINHLESFRLKKSRCQVQLTVNYVLFVCTYTESTDRVFLRYRYGNYREIPAEYRPKIPNRYTTLVISQRNHNFGADTQIKKKLRWFSVEFLRVRRKITSTPSYAYLRICLFSKEITA
jgi:hypothetical protein